MKLTLLALVFLCGCKHDTYYKQQATPKPAPLAANSTSPAEVILNSYEQQREIEAARHRQLLNTHRNSRSFKRLVAVFGENGVSFECNPDLAAAEGPDYLYEVWSSNNGAQYGEIYGHGATLQSALDDAAAYYMSPGVVRRFEAEDKADADAESKRKAYYRKKCCTEVQP